jgi:hypothetical protein
MVSAISNRGQLYFSVFTGKFDISVFENFLSRLIRQSGKKVFIIIDGHPVHRSKRIKAFAEENKENIRIFFLPSYSPELNPDERLNQDVRLMPREENAPTIRNKWRKIFALICTAARRVLKL